MVVEDIEGSYNLLEVILGMFNIETIWAPNGQDSIDIIKSNETIDLVLMDLNMPVLNGIEATKIIKSLKPDLPIIAQTAYAVSGDKEKALGAGCDDYISKPIDKENLITLIKKYLP